MPKDVIFYTDEDELSGWDELQVIMHVVHIELQSWADIMVVAPLSVNALGKVIFDSLEISLLHKVVLS